MLESVLPKSATRVLVCLTPVSDPLLLYFVDEIGEQILTKKLEKGSFLLPVPAENGAPFVEVSPSRLPRLFRSP